MSYTSTQIQNGIFPGGTNLTVENGYQDAMGGILGASNPYTSYQGNLFAPTTGTQNQASLNEASLTGYQPQMVQAGNILGNAGGAGQNEYGLTGYQAQQVTPGSILANSGQAGQNEAALSGYQAQQIGAGNAAQYAGGTGAGGLSTDGMDLSGYMNPYTSQVINTTMTQLNNQLAATNAASDANATTAGAFGGDRAAIVDAQNAYNTNQIAAQTIAGLNQSNYTNAESQAQTDLSRQASVGTSEAQLQTQAAQANQSAGLQAAGLQNTANSELLGIGAQQTQLGLQGQMANQSAGLSSAGLQNTANSELLGIGAQQAQLGLQANQGNQFASLQGANLQNTANNALFGMGTTQQQTAQNADNALYQQYILGQQYPVTLQGLGAQATSQYAGALNDNGNITSQLTQPGPSTTSQVLGGLTALGALSSGASGGLLGAAGSAIGSGYNYLFGSGSGAASGASDVTDGVDLTASSPIVTQGVQDAANGIYTVFRDGGRVGYADGGAVDDDDGTFLSADDDDTTRLPNGLTGAAGPSPMLLASASGPGGGPPSALGAGDLPIATDAGGLAGAAKAPVAAAAPPVAAGAGTPAAMAPTVQQALGAGGGAGGVVSPDNGGDNAAAIQTFLNATQPPPASPALFQQGGGDQAKGSQVNVPLGNVAAALPPPDMTPPPSPVNSPPPQQPAPKGGLAGAARGAPPAPAAGGIAAAAAPAPALPPPSPIARSANPSAPLPGAKSPLQGGLAGAAQSMAPAATPTAPSASTPGQGLAGAMQPRPGTPGAPSIPGAGGAPGGQNPDFIDSLYARGGNSWAMPMLAAGAAMMASRDPHPGVAIGQGLQAAIGQANQTEQSRNEAGMRMLQMQNNHDYQMGMLGVRGQQAGIQQQRADTYAGAAFSREQLQSAQTALDYARSTAPPKATEASIQANAIAAYKQANPGATDLEAYGAVQALGHNYTATNNYRQARLGQMGDQQQALQAQRAAANAMRATAQEDQGARALMQADLSAGKPPRSYTQAIQDYRSAHAANGPAAVPGSSAGSGAPQYVEGRTATGANGQKLVYSGGAWQPAPAATQ